MSGETAARSSDELNFSLSEDETEDSRKSSSSSSNDEIAYRKKKMHTRRGIITSDSDSEEDRNDALKNTSMKSRKSRESRNFTLCSAGSHTMEESEEDDIIEQQAFSPRTRQSITGYWRHSDGNEEESSASTSDDEEVINETLASISENDSRKSTENAEAKEQMKDSNEEESYVSNSYDEEVINETLASISENDSRKSTENAEVKEQTNDVKDSAVETIILDSSAENVDSVFDDSNENSFTASIKQKMSSTLSVEEDSEVQEIQKNKTLVSNPLSSDIPNSKVVSKAYYENELRILENLKLDLKKTENLPETLKSKLSDNGKRLIVLSNKLKDQIAQKEKIISTLTVEDDLKSEKPSSNVPDWKELSEAVNEVQPKYTGKVGLGTFNTQKFLTIERLKDIHSSLETRPLENVLAEQPKNLKTAMMEHQRHALAWMNWRERQKPRGGILADDMGLGKTLTMISLVLDVKEKEEVESEEESSSDHGAAGGWSCKGRRDYYNGGTLVVCPASLVEQWEKEVEKHTKRNSLNVSVHHGSNRETRPRRLAKYDMVFTTYNIVLREHSSSGTVFGIKWARLILDEAHIIRNHKSQTSVAVCSLQGRCRWALTGTPVQNKEMDLYAILKFLRCSPFDDIGHWRKWVDNKSEGGKQRLQTLIQSLMLRRTKVQLQASGHLQCLPEKSTELIEVNLQRDEMNVYQRIMLYSRTIFAQYLYQRTQREDMPFSRQTQGTNGTLWKMHQRFARLQGVNEVQTHQILVLLLRLRQICCHPGLINSMLEEASDDLGNSRSDESDTEIDLLAQLEKLHIEDDTETNPVASTTEEAVENGASKASSKILLKSNPVFDLERPSSKVLAVLKVLEEIVLSSGDKAIVVSQWTGVLNIIKVHLAKRGVQTSSLDGTIPVNKRQTIITSFNDPQNATKVLLLSLTAGGVGLNLVGANHLLLVDLHWNPQLEFQAQDRIYRVGQKKTVHIYKFMCKDTVEAYIKILQERKLSIANGILTGAKHNQGSKLTIEDLKGLFGM